jgi:AAA domain
VRIDRVRLKNFSGVSDAEVRFAPVGVTIVHGPNEAGKSTLMQGINVLFDFRDDSRHEEVRNTKPVNRDVGSEVEADIEIGAYNFTYFKRFHKERETRLTIRTPRAENLSGREAHDRVQQILSGSVDTALWRALRIAQGQHLKMPELHNQPALAQALDRAAGQAKSGEQEEALFEAAQAEYARYFTDKGREKEDPIGQARTHAADAATRLLSLQTQLKELEDDLNRYANLEKSVATHRRSVGILQDARKKAQADWDEVSKLAANLERASSAHQLAVQAAQNSKAAVQQRAEQVTRVQTSGEAARHAAALQASATSAHSEAAQRLNFASTAQAAAQKIASQMETEAVIREADLKFREGEFALVLLQERLTNVREADADAASATAFVAASKITEKLRASIREAELAVKTAQGVLNVASPQLTITALQAISIAINGVTHSLATGEQRAMAVNEVVCATFAHLAEFRVEPGTSAQALRQAVAQAEAVLAKACAKAGVTTPEQAETAWTALADAKRTVAECDRIARQHLRDLTRETLGQLVVTTQAGVTAYLGNRSSELAVSSTVDQARTLNATALQAAVQARRALSEAQAALVPVQAHHAEFSQNRAVKAALLDQANKDHHQEEARLQGERTTRDDDFLNRVLEESLAAAAGAAEHLQSAKALLGARDPASVKALFHSTEPALNHAREQCEGQEENLIALRTKLELVGDKGLAQDLSEAERVAFEAGDTLQRLLRRAGAAKLLFELLRSEQQAMRRAYVTPLRDGIERLGRHVFGPSLRVDVDDRLQVTSRTIDEVTVALELLSTGAREQMGLLVRLAAASMVSKDGGVPLVLDDALGATDENRIEAMGAVLRMASLNLQTIILTCSPERYVHVGARVSVSL